MENQKINWYKVLLTDCNGLAEKFGLDDSQTEELRSFVVDTAKEQYKTGNKSGARWAFAEVQKKQMVDVKA